MLEKFKPLLFAGFLFCTPFRFKGVSFYKLVYKLFTNGNFINNYKYNKKTNCFYIFNWCIVVIYQKISLNYYNNSIKKHIN